MIPALLGLGALAREPLGYGLQGVDLGCAACDLLGPAQLPVEASRTLPGSYATANLLNGRAATARCGGADGPGVGATLRLSWPEPLLQANARPRKVRIRTSAGPERQVELADPAVPLGNDPSLPPPWRRSPPAPGSRARATPARP